MFAVGFLYCTVNDTVVDPVIADVPDPDVAVMITEYVPAGVPEVVCCAALDPPHPEIAPHVQMTTAKKRPE